MQSLERKLGRAVSRAIADFAMIEDGDRILVAVSGGKDSYTLLHLLRGLQRKAPVRFELKVVNVDQGHPGYPGHLLREYMAREGYDFSMIEQDTYSIVIEKIPAGKTYCSLCSRLRRGILYRAAKDFGCNKIALGHHRDDVLQTLLLNLLFAGMLASMPPKLVADGGAHVVIRPLVYCAEEDIRAFAEAAAFPILPCDLCGSQDHLQRKAVGRMLDSLERDRPGTKAVMMAALRNVRPSHLLDRALWRAIGVHAALEQEDGGAGAGPGGLVAEQRLVRG
jgi:tRNA 2-thiocytidine biosynthesis protein TtcA